MIEISKELLGEVYNFEVKDFVQLGTDDTTYEVRFNGLKNGTNYNIINIYELVHKCKEWVNYYGFFLYPARAFECTFVQYGCAIMKPEYHAGRFVGLFGIDRYDERDYLASTEVEAVIKACEWILKELKK